jgi:NADPH:quinone reductase-like Zn-dependent oxidoreductase
LAGFLIVECMGTSIFMQLMRAASTRSYGPPAVLEVTAIPRPTLDAHGVLVEVHAASVTAGDVRLRTADFPSISALPGRLLVGLFRPRHSVQGTMFAGRVVEVGSAVTRHRIGDDVFGFTDHGAYAEYLSVSESSAIARMPSGVSYEDAAAIPYGAGTALYFLRDLAAVRPGEHVLIVGAAGGVGRFAVSIAKHLGARVTAVCAARSFDLVRSLGADDVLDYASTDFTRDDDRYDVVFDIANASSFLASRRTLTTRGRYLTLTLSVSLLVFILSSALLPGRRAKFGIAIPSADVMEEIRMLTERGVLRPVIAKRFPLEQIADAHAYSESARSAGSTIVALPAFAG